MKFPTRIPTIIGILLLICFVGGIIFFVEEAFRTDTKASGSHEPKQIRVTNISDAALTVSWVTELPTTGTLLVTTKGKTNKVYFDERDSSGKLGKYTAHSITARNITADSEYLVTPLVDGKPHILADKPIQVHTPATLSLNTGGLEPAYGFVQNSDGSPNTDAIIYLTIEGGQELSTLSKPSGNWIIPLNQARTEDLTSFLPIVERMNQSIQIFSGTQQATIVTDPLNDSPIPEVQMGKEYDFRRQQAKKPTNSTLALRPITPTIQVKTDTASLPIGGAVLGQTASKNFIVSLTNPKKDSALATSLPLIQGTGIPGKFIGISIGLINPSHGSIQVSADGSWNFTPKKPLAPGKQSVTISTVDATGKAVAITHIFELFKSGTQVLGDATSSASITVAPTISEVPISETPTDSTIAGNPPPVSGNQLPTLILLLLGFGLVAGSSIALRR